MRGNVAGSGSIGSRKRSAKPRFARMLLGWILSVSPAVATVAQVPTLAIAQSPQSTAESLLQQGNQQYQAGRIDAAIAVWQQARQRFQQQQDVAGESAALANLGTAYLRLERYREAIAVLEALLPLTQSLNDSAGEATTLGNLGIAYRALGDYSKAVTVYKQAARQMLTLGDRRGVGQVLNNLGNVYETLGEFEMATKLYEQSRSLAQQTQDEVGVAVALANLGAVAAKQEQDKPAIALFEQSLALSRKFGDRAGEANTLINLGASYHSLGDLPQALTHYQQALALAQSTRDRRRESEALGSLALVYEDEKQYEKAIQFHQQSVAIARELKDPQFTGMVLNNYGHTLLNAGRLAEAETVLREAVQRLDALRPGLSDRYKVSIFDTQVHTYNLLLQVLVEAHKPEAALEISEHGRARAFVELLAGRFGSKQASNAPVTIAQIKEIARQQQAVLVEYALIPDDAFKFRGKQRGSVKELFVWVVQPTGDVAFRRVSLQPDKTQKVFLSNLVGSARVAIGVRGRGIGVQADGDADEFFRVGDQVRREQEPLSAAPYRVEAVNQKEKTLILSQADKRLPDPVPMAQVYKVDSRRARTLHWRELHRLLIAPIADLLPANPDVPVVFVPQEHLFLVPFAALQNSAGEYLIQRHTVLTVPAIQVLATTRRSSSTGEGSLVVGNPAPMPNSFSALPGSETEANEIAQLLHVSPLIRQAATEAAVKQRWTKARLIHLATHGIFDEENPLRGAIALAPGGKEDGLLTAEEILQQRLQADLVILSACDTGRGRITGDGVLGLARSLMAAGAPSVVVSLWQVPDAPTAALMTAFHRERLQRGNTARSLRRAMLQTLKVHPDPVNWAAFTLVGQPR